MFIWFFPLTIFSSLRLFRGFFFPMGGSPQLVHLLDPIHTGCTRLVHVVCTLCTLSLVAVLTKLHSHTAHGWLSVLHGGC